MNQNVYGIEMVIYALFYFLSLVIGYVVIYRNRRESTLSEKAARTAGTEKTAGYLLVLLLSAGFILRFFLSNWVEGFPNDMACFKGWASAAAYDLPGFYTKGMFCDYPPFYVYVLFIVGKLAGLQIPFLNFTLLVKLPSIIADTAISYMLYRMARKKASPFQSVFIAGAFVFNPASIVETSVWGMMDSFFVMFVMFSILFIIKDRLEIAAVFMVCTVLMKPQGVFFIPVLLYALIRKKDIKTWLLSAIYSVMTLIIVILPFSHGQDPLWIFRLYLKTAEGYTAASLNAFNLFAFLGANLKADSGSFLFLSYSQWGLLLIATLAVFSAFVYFRAAKPVGPDKPPGVTIPLITSDPAFIALLLNIGIFTLSTRMHERYMYPAIALSLLLFARTADKMAGLVFAVSSLTVFLNIHTVLYSMLNTGTPHIRPDDPVLITVSYMNLILLAYLVKTAISRNGNRTVKRRKMPSSVKKAVSVIILLLSVSIPVSNAVAADSVNIIMNPGFEEGGSGSPYYWFTDSWEDKGLFDWDNTICHEGSSSVRIANDEPTDSRFKQKLIVEPDTYYRISCWILTEDVGTQTKGANLSFEGIFSSTRDISGTSPDWEYVEVYGITGAEQDELVVTLGLGGYGSLNSGKAWFDDVDMVKLDAVPEGNEIQNLFTHAGDAGTGGGSRGKDPNAWIRAAAVLFVALAAAAYFIKKRDTLKTKPFNHGDADMVKTPEYRAEPVKTAKPDKKDFLIISLLTVVYSVVAILNLGSLKVPETSWTPHAPGSSFTVDFGREVNIGKIYYYCGLGCDRPDEGRYRIQYEDDSDRYEHLSTIEKKDIFIWKVVDTPKIYVQKLKVIVDVPGGTINEMAFFEEGSKTPVGPVTIIADGTGGGNAQIGDIGSTDGAAANLFDEQDRIDYKHSYLSGMIFDEIYHARTAYEYIHGMEPYEWTHPPLGKLLISAGIAVFGMVPFGWRIVGTLFGIAMIPLIYLFAFKLFNRRLYAFIAAFLFSVDFMHFGLTRIATIDVFVVFFIILMYYFMFDYYNHKSYERGFKKSLRPLLYCGICFGLGAACKWIGIYAGGGLALLFFLAKYREYKEYRTLSKRKPRPEWTDRFMPVYMYRTILYCVLFFIIIPAAIYTASYIPYLSAPGSGHDFGYILRNQSNMLHYHSVDVIGATHPFSSYWWEWPLISRPLETYAATGLSGGMSSTMTIMGNPLIWWTGIIAVIAAIYHAIRQKDRKMQVVFAAMAFQYLPWVGVTRIVFIYHFFSTVPFMIICIAYCAKIYVENYNGRKYAVYGFLALSAILFIMFYPVLSGLEVPRTYVDQFLQWFRTKWVF